MKLTMATLDINDTLLRTMSSFVFVRLVRVQLDINLKLNMGSNRFINGSNLYPQCWGIFDVKEFSTGIIKSGVNIRQPSEKVIKARSG